MVLGILAQSLMQIGALVATVDSVTGVTSEGVSRATLVALGVDHRLVIRLAGLADGLPANAALAGVGRAAGMPFDIDAQVAVQAAASAGAVCRPARRTCSGVAGTTLMSPRILT